VSDQEILAVDVGATSIRSVRFSYDGAAVGKRSRRSTPYPCGPERLVGVLQRLAAPAPVFAIGLGFPGEVCDGRVVDAANLTRASGPTSKVDEAIAASWRDFDLAGAVSGAVGVRVTLHNDAAMAALGCAKGDGVELMVTLGTGCGLALVRDGVLQQVRDVGNETLRGSATYDDVLGERGRRADEDAWRVHVVSAVTALASEFNATLIHLAGGNSRRLSPTEFGDWASSLLIERDDPALRGAWRACFL
jgi:polyphosphate glucokinase